MGRPRLAVALLFGPAVAWSLVAAVGLAQAAMDSQAWGSADRASAPVRGSADCRRCHPDQHRTWHASWHRTMTQDIAAEDAIVLAPFAGERLEYGGFVAIMDRDAGGRPRVRVWPEPIDGGDVQGEPLRSHLVDLAIGSHRYQQYASRGPDGSVTRLPVAYHRATARWIHLNGAFVEPEGPEGSPEEWDRHVTRWNDGCVFCHNTEPQPGIDPEGGIDTKLGEIGIACEACHGRGGEHVARHANPFRRMLADGAEPDASIAQPGRLADGRASEVCGRCHGNRIAKDVARVLQVGDEFVPGTSLSERSRPIFADSTLEGHDGRPFASRFWPDETPRLSAHEWQGLLLSPCHLDGAPGGMQCGDCHTMHGEERDMQLIDAPRDAACVRCHAGGSEAPAASPENDGAPIGVGHGGHVGRMGPDRRPVDCLDCHMPRTTYGLLEGMISHRVTSPDPARWVGRDDMPDACTHCHVDRSRAWAADGLDRLDLGGSAMLDGDVAEHEAWASRVELDLFGGDALQRNLAAHALARPEAVGDPKRRLAALIEAMDDEYPSVRWFAWRGALALAEAVPLGEPELARLRAFDTLAPVEQRVRSVQRLREAVGDGPLTGHPGRREFLEARRDAVVVWIGE